MGFVLSLSGLREYFAGAVKRGVRGMNEVQGISRVGSYWLVERDGSQESEIMTIRSTASQQTLPVFSFREEAELFLYLRGSGEDPHNGWRVRQTAPGELLSLFRTVLGGLTHVTLDPIPEVSSLDTSGFLSIAREDFVVRLQSRSGGGEVIEIESSGSPGSGRYRTGQRTG